MADSVCVGCGLTTDANGAVAANPDNNTIVCRTNAAGESQLVAVGLDCDAWPHTCNPTGNANQVYCNDYKLYTEKPYNSRFRVGNFDTDDYPPLFSQATGSTVKELTHRITNNDPCGRKWCVNVFYNFNKYTVQIDPGARFELDAAVTTEGVSNYHVEFDSGFINYEAGRETVNSGGTHSWTDMVEIPYGQNKVIGMKWQIGPDHHSTAQWSPQDPSGAAIYGMYMDFQVTTECDNFNVGFAAPIA